MKRRSSGMTFIRFVWIACLFLSNFIFAQSYLVEIKKSKISWVGWKQLFGNPLPQKGILKFRSGSFYVRNGSIINAILKMDMNSISHLNDGKVYTDNDVVTHLKSESCFFVEKYPEAIFRLEGAETRIDGDNNNVPQNITGTLTIKGITKTLSFPIRITQTKESLIIRAVFQISRKEFDLDLEPFLIPVGGNRIVRDNIDITVELQAQPES